MQFSLLSLAALIAVASASPTNMKRQAAVPLCSSGSPQCCATDVLGLVDLDCANRKW
jgi:Fungal hydrophobin